VALKCSRDCRRRGALRHLSGKLVVSRKITDVVVWIDSFTGSRLPDDGTTPPMR
jgi:hypothetical protein